MRRKLQFMNWEITDIQPIIHKENNTKCSVKIGFSKNWWIERKIATGQSPQLMFTPRYNRIPRKTKSKRMARGELDARSLYHLACDRVEWTSQLRRCITGTFSLTSCPKRQSRQRKALVRSSHLIDFVSLTALSQ